MLYQWRHPGEFSYTFNLHYPKCNKLLYIMFTNLSHTYFPMLISECKFKS